MKVTVERESGISVVRNVYVVASTNTDVPTYYSKWFFDCLHAGCVDIPAYNDPNLTIRVSLQPEDVRGFIFYSKNYGPFLRMCDPLVGRRVLFFFTMGDSAAFQARVPAMEVLLTQVDMLLARFGHEAFVWKLPPVFFDRDGKLRYMENVPAVAEAMAERGVKRCMIELFSAGFHPREIRDRLIRNGISDFNEEESAAKYASVAGLIEELEVVYGLQVLEGTSLLFPDLHVSDIEDRVEVFDIGRMGMPCPTKCLYCDTNFTVNYDNEGRKRLALEMDSEGWSCGLERYLHSLGLNVTQTRNNASVSPYSVELRASHEVALSAQQNELMVGTSDEGPDHVRLIVNVLGDDERHRRAYVLDSDT